MKTIMTSYYAVVHKLPSEYNPVGISRGEFKHRNDIPYMKELAPTWKMMKMTDEDYDKHMRQILENLDAEKVYNALPENAVLLCYEKFNDRCHRRMVAEWLEEKLGITVTEWGLKREESFPYSETCKQLKGVKRNPNKPQNIMQEKRTREQVIAEAKRKQKEAEEKENNRNLTFDDFL